MSTPNSMYEDTSIYGGIAVLSNDIIKIFCDVERIIKVQRSMIKLQYENEKIYYTLINPEILLRVNGTAVKLRCTSMDMSSAYMFDPKSDAFLGVVKRTIPVFGDIKSMSEDDHVAIMQHGNKRKAIQKECKARLSDINSSLEEDPQFEVSLKVFGSTKIQ